MIRLFIMAFMSLLFVIQQGASLSVEAREQVAASSKQKSTKASTPDRAITGLVLDDAGEPIEGAQIIVSRVNFRNQMLFINTDKAGRFETSKLDSGFYALDVQWLGYIVNPDGLRPGFYRPGEHLTFNLIKGGVIAGRITEASGEPAVAEVVIAQRVRDLDGHKAIGSPISHLTDDRGVYRIYGLESGRYILRANVSSGVYISGNEAGEEIATYYPSSTRDTAVEISVQAGAEVSGIDIQLRADRGHVISGTVTGDIGNSAEGISVKLVNLMSGEIEKTAGLYKAQHFALFGVPDGEYEIYAQKLYGQGGNAGSALRRVVVRGADLIGVDLKLIRYGTIAGRVTIDSATVDSPAPRCGAKAESHLEEIMLNARVDSPTPRRQDQFFAADEYWGSWRGSVADLKGEFKIQNLEAGLYRLDIDLPGEDWYIRSITQPAVGVKKRVDIARAGFALKPSEQMTGVEAVIAEGGASLRGQVVLAPDELSKNRLQLQVHLLPAEEAAAGDLLRYAETLAGKNGAFEFKNLAPGKYWLLAKPAPEVESFNTPRRSAAWDDAERVKLRREAKVIKNEIELKSCERLVDYALKVNLR